MMSDKRRFATPEEVTKFILEMVPVSDMPDADQLNAATRDSEAFTAKLTVGLAHADLLEAHYTADTPSWADPTDHLLRTYAAEYLAAQSIGIRAVCPHANINGRPVVVLLDPCIAACHACFPYQLKRAMRTGFRFDHECDRCGSTTEMMRPFTRNYGPFTFHGHLCDACFEEDKAWSAARNRIDWGREARIMREERGH